MLINPTDEDEKSAKEILLVLALSGKIDGLTVSDLRDEVQPLAISLAIIRAAGYTVSV